MLLYGVFLAVAAVVFVVAAAIVGWSIVRYRGTGDGPERPGPYQDVRLDLLWWALPTALVIVLFLLTAQVLGAADQRTDDLERTVTITGLRFLSFGGS